MTAKSAQGMPKWEFTDGSAIEPAPAASASLAAGNPAAANRGPKARGSRIRASCHEGGVGPPACGTDIQTAAGAVPVRANLRPTVPTRAVRGNETGRPQVRGPPP